MGRGLRALVYSPTEELQAQQAKDAAITPWAASQLAPVRELFSPVQVVPAPEETPRKRGIRPRGEPERGQDLDVSVLSTADQMACGVGCTGFEGFWVQIKRFLGLEDPLQRLPPKPSQRKFEEQFGEFLRTSTESLGPAFAIGEPGTAQQAAPPRPFTAGGPLPQQPSVGDSLEFPHGIHSSYYARSALHFAPYTSDVGDYAPSHEPLPAPLSSASYGHALPLATVTQPPLQPPAHYSSVDAARDSLYYTRPPAQQAIAAEPPKGSAQAYAQQLLEQQRRLDEERRQQQRLEEQRREQERLEAERLAQQNLARAAAQLVQLRQQAPTLAPPGHPEPAVYRPPSVAEGPFYYAPATPGDVSALPAEGISPPRRQTVVYEPFVSGLWRGFYQYMFGERDEMKLNLDMRDGKIRADGVDNVGRYTIQGQYDPATREVFFVKTYQGRHSVEYAGFAEEESISGDWEVLNIPGQAFQLRGSFRMWKPGAFSPELLDAL
eukprot:tig00020556_g11037.t1